jgi:4-alpha-glucanotransferase
MNVTSRGQESRESGPYDIEPRRPSPEGKNVLATKDVGYPQNALFTSLSILSNRYACLVIGEDLGNLPEGLQIDLVAANILSYRILSYEQDKKGFISPDRYPSLALACVSTHDHQTFSGWWEGANVKMRKNNGRITEAASVVQTKERKAEKRKILAAFKDAGLTEGASGQHPSQIGVEGLAAVAHRYIARTPSMLMAVRLADLTEKHPTNVPGTKESYPNWKPKLSLKLDKPEGCANLQATIKAVKDDHSRPSPSLTLNPEVLR